MKSVSRFKEGDKIKVSAGPYYLTKLGKKIKLGKSGNAVFIAPHLDGKGIIVMFDGERSTSYVYVGPEVISELTGTIMRPHKISKKRS